MSAENLNLARRTARADLWKRIVIVLALLFTASGLIVNLVTVVLIRQTQQDGSPILKEVIALSETISSCVTPGKPCYDNGQARTGKAVESINKITTLAIACADEAGVQTLEEIRACVLKNLSEETPDE